jgi:hypothetical protein
LGYVLEAGDPDVMSLSVVWRDLGQKFRDGFVECFFAASFYGAEQLFEFGPGLFEGVQVG